MTAPAMQPVLEVRNLITEFAMRRGPFRAVDDVSFALHAGRTLCLVGESGSGKSVSARSILQIVDPPGTVKSGQVLLHRHRIARGAGSGENTIDLAQLGPRSSAIRAIRGRDIAMIFQEPMSSLSPVHTIGNQIIEVIRLHESMSKQEARARAIELLRKVEIPNPERTIDRYPFEYSGGMRQRAMIAMALACTPGVLIADEPTTALDVTTQAEILALIRKLQETEGMAVLFITHDMGVVAEIADEVAVMRFGKIVEQGDTLAIFENPQHDYTKMLLGSVKQLDRPSARRLARRKEKPPGEILLDVEKLKKTFWLDAGWFNKGDPLHAVNEVTLQLRAGENLGIVGESGSGKSTLGRTIMRVYGSDGGAIRYTGKNGETRDLALLGDNALKDARRELRMVFQDPMSSLNPRMTVEQLIGEPLLVNGLLSGKALKTRVGELLELVGLPAGAMERYPHAFSGGQRQRIGIARAIALDPRVIIADEATSALDVSLRSQVLDLLLDLQERLDLSFIFISHDIAVIRYFCDRIAVMYRGRIVEEGPTEDVCTNPQHAYTQSLLSAVPHPDPRMRGTRVRVRYRGEA